MLKHASYRSSSTSLSRTYDDYSLRSTTGSLRSPSESKRSPSESKRSPSDTSSLNRSHLSTLRNNSNLSYTPSGFSKADLSHLDSFSSSSSYTLNRSTPDNVSLTSALSFSSLAFDGKYYCPAGTTEQATVPVKIYLRRLRSDMQYKTVSLSLQTTCYDLILLLLLKFRLRHRDPKLFFVLMEVTVRSPLDGAPVKRQLVLGDDARPAELQQCRPKGEANFSVGVRRGGLLRVYDSVLMPGSQYKSLMVSSDTNSDELVQLLLNCYNNPEDPKNYRVHEVCKGGAIDRPLGADEYPIQVQSSWPKDGKLVWMFVLRRDVSYTLRNINAKLSWRRRSLDQLSNTDTDSETDSDDHNTTRSSIMSTSSTISNSSSTSSTTSSSSSTSSSSGVSSQYSSSSDSTAAELRTPESSPLKSTSSSRTVLDTKGSTGTLVPSSAEKLVPGGKPPKPVPRTLFPEPVTPRQKSLSTTTLTNEDDSGIGMDDTDGVTPFKIEDYDHDLKPELPPRSFTISSGTSPVVPAPVRRFASIKSLSKSTVNLSLGSPKSNVKSRSFLNLSLSPFSDKNLPSATSTPKSTGPKEAFKSTLTGRRYSIGDLTSSSPLKMKASPGTTKNSCSCKNCFYI